jgi:CRISPR-associated endonuclease/helicase Cas3
VIFFASSDDGNGYYDVFMTMFDKRFYALWAKSGKDGHSGHPVVAHLLDVAASTWAILEQEPKSTKELYARDFNLQESEAMPWVYALAGLHDLGKVSPAFQQKWSEGFERLVLVEPSFDWRTTKRLPPITPPKDVSHSLISQVMLPNLLINKGVHASTARKIADAVGCHHGFRAKKVESDEKDHGLGLWDEARKVIFEAVLQTVGVTTLPGIKTFSAAAWMRLAGLTSLADWIGSSFYPEITFDDFNDNLVGYYEKAKMLAQKRLHEIGWTKREALVTENKSLEQVFAYLTKDSNKPFVPRTLQLKVKELLENTSKPTLLLIEAAMVKEKLKLLSTHTCVCRHRLHIVAFMWHCPQWQQETLCLTARQRLSTSKQPGELFP